MNTAQAMDEFRTAYTAMLCAAEVVRQAVEIESGQSGGRGSMQIAAIQNLVADHYGYGVVFLTARNNTRPVVTARHVAMWLCRRLTKNSLTSIGQAFGDRDHGTVFCALRSMSNRRTTEPAFHAECQTLLLKAIELLGTNTKISNSDPSQQ